MNRIFILAALVSVMSLAGCPDNNPRRDRAPPADQPEAGAPGACRTDPDCRLFDDYCTGCDCRALGKSDPDPTCSGPGVRCIRQPCADRVATCVAGKCTARPAMQDRAAPSQ